MDQVTEKDAVFIKRMKSIHDELCERVAKLYADTDTEVLRKIHLATDPALTSAEMASIFRILMLFSSQDLLSNTLVNITEYRDCDDTSKVIE